MSENVTKITASTKIDNVDETSASSFTDIAKETDTIVRDVLKKCSGKSMTLGDVGLEMRIALDNGYKLLNKRRKDAGLAPARLKNGALDAATIAAIIDDRMIIRKVVYNAHDFSEIASSELYVYNAPKNIIPTTNNYTKESGIYTCLYVDDITKYVQEIQRGADSKLVNEVVACLRSTAKVVEEDKTPSHIYCNNCVFDYDTREMMDFSPDLVTRRKLPDNLIPDAPNVVLKKGENGEPDYRAEDIIGSLSDYDYTVDALYRIIGACVRTKFKWCTMAWLMGHEGSNGKSMFADLNRSMVGRSDTAEIPLKDYGSEFGLEHAYGKHVLITSDSNKREYMESMGALKQLTGKDPININRKKKDHVEYEFTGMILILMNNPPSMAYEKALDRRIMKVNFDKTFIKNAVDIKKRADPAIADDYIFRKEVHEWLLKHVLLDIPQYYSLETPAETAKEFDQSYREDQSIIMRFLKTSRLLEFMGVEDASALRALGIATGESQIEGRVTFPIGRQLLFDIFQRWCELENEQMKGGIYGGYTCNNFLKELKTTLKDYPDIAPIELVEGKRDRIYYRHNDEDLRTLADEMKRYFIGTKSKPSGYYKDLQPGGAAEIFGLKKLHQENVYVRVKNSDAGTE